MTVLLPLDLGEDSFSVIGVSQNSPLLRGHFWICVGSSRPRVPREDR